VLLVIPKNQVTKCYKSPISLKAAGSLLTMTNNSITELLSQGGYKQIV